MADLGSVGTKGIQEDLAFNVYSNDRGVYHSRVATQFKGLFSWSSPTVIQSTLRYAYIHAS